MSPQRLIPRSHLAWYAATVALFVVDRVLKALALTGGRLGRPDLVEFSLFRNHGIAFSLPLPSLLYWIAVPILFLLLTAFLVRTFRARDSRATLAFLVLAGAASNILDRALHGAVIDYLIFFGRSAVNLADGMIVAGLIALASAPRSAPKTGG